MIERIPAPWGGLVLICRKCTRKLDGGFGPDGDQKLGRVLRHELKAAGRRRTFRMVEVGCLGLCPKKAVAVAGPRDPAALLAVPKGTAAGAVIAALTGE